MIDPALARLYAEYIRGGDGVRDVLHDALLERGEEPLPDEPDPAARIDRVFARLPLERRLAIACAVTRRVLHHYRGAHDVELALAALEHGQSIEMHRRVVFAAWHACAGDRAPAAAGRAVWCVWMLLRGLPHLALATARAIDAAEVPAQIDLVAAMVDS